MSLSFFVGGGPLRYAGEPTPEAQLWLHSPALIVGFALAFGGIPVYGNVFWGCYVPPPPLAETHYRNVIFASICTAIAILTVNMGLVYWSVRKQMIAARKSRISWVRRRNDSSLARNATASGDLPMNLDASDLSVQSRRRETGEMVIQKMERRTFWQALFYLGAFYLTWPILLAPPFIQNGREEDKYPYTLTVLMLASLQGFLNFLVYARPRILKRIQALRLGHQTSQDKSTSLRISGAAAIVDP
jgi:hypothetical protein